MSTAYASDELITTGEVLRILEISRTTLYERMSEGLLEPVNKPNAMKKRQRRNLFRREDVERLAQPIQRAG